MTTITTAMRIIPARAGFTDGGTIPDGEAGDHPRSRGVYSDRPPSHPPPSGSSPLARGLPHLVGGRPVRRVDHPRSRGVYSRVSFRVSRFAGSSPLARGLPDVLAQQRPHHGIIPARAGFTAGRGRSRAGPGDHPRSRGVYAASVSGQPRSRGSSPLARGLLWVDSAAIGTMGIIPARAGFTPPDRVGDRPRPDHPRSRGVYPSNSPPRRRGSGSSPLARGLRATDETLNSGTRIIPARAGFTAGAGHYRR